MRRELAEASGGEGGEAEAEQHARDCAFDAAEVRHRSEEKLSYRGDVGEIWGRCRGGVAEMQGRCRGDAGEMQERCRGGVGEV